MHLAVALVLRGHFDEVAQAALEDRLVATRHIKPADADALVPFREAPEVFQIFRVAIKAVTMSGGRPFLLSLWHYEGVALPSN